MTQAAANRHVVIVGASLAGTRTAQGLRALGHAGDITLVGAEPELPYDRPPLSKALLQGEWSADAAEGVRLISPAELDTLGVELRLGSAATGLDTAGQSVRLADGPAVPYDVLVIATGATAVPPPRQLKYWTTFQLVSRCHHVGVSHGLAPPSLAMKTTLSKCLINICGSLYDSKESPWPPLPGRGQKVAS